MKLSQTLFTVLSFFICFSPTVLSAQTPIDEAVRRADEPPAWPHCDPMMTECTKARVADFIAANIQVPPEAKAENAGGLVMMEFVVEKNGMVGEVKAVHDPGLGLGAEATRVIELMKTQKIKWTPARVDGKKVAYRYTVPVSFSLTMPEKPKSGTTIAPAADGSNVYDIAEEMPRYAGCDKPEDGSDECTFSKMVSHIKTNLKYPEEAMKNQIEGQVVATFVIDTSGQVTQSTIKSGLGHGCDEEVLRVLALMPAWTPGMQGGETVNIRMTIPVMFQLPKVKEEEEKEK